MKFILPLIVASALFACKSSPNESTDSQKKPKKELVNKQHSPTMMENDYRISVVSLEKTVSYLASDELKGRDTGSEGIDKAAQYLEKDLSTFGVKPFFDTYRDNFKVNELDAYNVVGVVEGNDHDLKKEYILIGAHYDHIGIIKADGGDSIANGANDNASGTATILELARYFGKNNSNKRSLIFAFFSAEEKGLRGSRHLAKKLLEQNLNLYSMINFEMTGVPFKDRDYVAFLTGYDLSNMADIMNKYAGEKLIGKSEVAVKNSLFRRSDNYVFYQEFNVPSQTVSTCDLSNFDFYHKVGDEPSVIDYNHMANFTNKMIPVLEGISNTSTQEIRMNDN